MTRLLLAALAAACLGGCTATYAPLQDYVMPAQCNAEALSKITTTVVEVEKLTYLENGKHRTAYGMWDDRSDHHVIWLVRGLPEALRSETLAHERCHELMWRETGNGLWHG